MGAFSIVPLSGFSVVGHGTVLSSTAVVWLMREPMALRFRNGIAIVPGPFALMTGVSGSNPLRFFLF